MNKRIAYHCGLCGRKRYVKTYPRSPCWCREELPNRHMYFRAQVSTFFVWIWQNIKLIFIREWK
jgi:hypothetical protein